MQKKSKAWYTQIASKEIQHKFKQLLIVFQMILLYLDELSFIINKNKSNLESFKTMIYILIYIVNPSFC